MKTIFIAFAGTLLSLSVWAQSNIYSLNIVGYYNLRIFPGDYLIANQLSNHTNTLDTIFNGSIPVGATFTMWDSSANHFLPLSTYTGTQWTINYTLNFGEGGLLSSTAEWTNTIVGEITSDFVVDVGLVNWNPNYADGLHLISSPVPYAEPIDFMFTNVVGRLPQNGEWVAIFDPATQSYTFTTFHTGTGWDNGDPVLGVGQAAWFDLGGGLAPGLNSIPMVPEPNALALAIAGTGLLFLRRFRQTCTA